MLPGFLSIGNFVWPRLTASVGPRYSPTMRYVMSSVVLLMLISASVGGLAPAAAAEPPENRRAPVPTEDYPLYDVIVDEKFLTPETKFVLLERITVTRLHPEQQGPLRLETFQEYDLFDHRLPLELVRDFLFKNHTPSTLEAHFGFGARYRFIAGDGSEQQEAALAPIPVLSSMRPLSIQEEPLDEPPAIIDRLAFSRVAYTFARHQALVYVEYNRPNGTGAGFAIWLRQSGTRWGIFDSELVWAARPR
jgi:hypothetical protein